MFRPLALATVLGIFFLLSNTVAHAQQGPEAHGREFQIWTGGGYGVKGVTLHTGVLTAGVRYGWILTEPHGPRILRGRFEYTVDAVPLFIVFQPMGNAYGAALYPVGLKWNMDSHRRIVPYVELGAGALATNTQVSPGTSRVNFVTNGGLGVHFLRKKSIWSADVRFMHISNAGISALNPGVNTMQLRLGVGWFIRPSR